MSPRRWAVTLLWVCTCVILQLHCAGEKCAFPFKYENKKYYECIQSDYLYKWCSLTEEYSGAWKICTEEDRAPCMFPFVYNGEIFGACTRKGSFRRKLWCSLTRNYNVDKVWRYCKN